MYIDMQLRNLKSAYSGSMTPKWEFHGGSHFNRHRYFHASMGNSAIMKQQKGQKVRRPETH